MVLSTYVFCDSICTEMTNFWLLCMYTGNKYTTQLDITYSMCFCSIYILLQVSDSPTFSTHFSENHPWRAALFLETWKTQVSGEEPHQGVHVQAAMVDPVANLITKDIPTPWRKSWEMGETWGWMSQEAWRCIVDICFFQILHIVSICLFISLNDFRLGHRHELFGWWGTDGSA